MPSHAQPQAAQVLDSDPEVRDAHYSTLAALHWLTEAWKRRQELADAGTDPTGDELLIERLDMLNRWLLSAERTIGAVSVDLDDAATSLRAPYTAHPHYLAAVRLHADILDAEARGDDDESLWTALDDRLDTLPVFHPGDSDAPYQALRELDSEAARAVKLRRQTPAGDLKTHDEKPVPPKARRQLRGAPEMLERIGRQNEDAEWLMRLNKKYDGPIITRQGATPVVDDAAFVEWWNGLLDRVKENDQQEADRKATLEAQYAYGKDATVVPEINGSVKRRRTRKITNDAE